MTTLEIAATIDYTLLKADATQEQIEELCRTAKHNGYFAVCIPPWMVRFAQTCLTNSEIRVCTVVGFPMGYQVTQVKAAECEKALADDAQEIDMVMNISAFKSGNLRLVAQEIGTIRQITEQTGAVLKVIVETGLMNEAELLEILKICEYNGVDFVKTSTGFNAVGAEIEKVKFMRNHLAPEVRIKASGGIKTADDALSFIRAGAARIGTSTALTFVPAL